MLGTVSVNFNLLFNPCCCLLSCPVILYIANLPLKSNLFIFIVSMSFPIFKSMILLAHAVWFLILPHYLNQLSNIIGKLHVVSSKFTFQFFEVFLQFFFFFYHSWRYIVFLWLLYCSIFLVHLTTTLSEVISQVNFCGKFSPT